MTGQAARSRWSCGWVVYGRSSGELQVQTPSRVSDSRQPAWCVKPWWLVQRDAGFSMVVSPQGNTRGPAEGGDVVGLSCGLAGVGQDLVPRPVARAQRCAARSQRRVAGAIWGVTEALWGVAQVYDVLSSCAAGGGDDQVDGGRDGCLSEDEVHHGVGAGLGDGQARVASGVLAPESLDRRPGLNGGVGGLDRPPGGHAGHGPRSKGVDCAVPCAVCRLPCACSRAPGRR